MPIITAKLLEGLPNWSAPSLRESWLKAVQTLIKNSQLNDHAGARELIRRIGQEWRRRTLNGEYEPFTLRAGSDLPAASGMIDTRGWTEEGMLGALGYHVGQMRGVSTQVRRQILHEIFEGELPPLISMEYMRAWGRPKTEARLQELAGTLAALTQLAKRQRRASLRQAIQEREADLAFIKHEYYEEGFQFVWPDTWV